MPDQKVILVVDDDSGYLESASMLLEALGYSHLEATDSRQAIQVAVSHPEIRLTLVDGLRGKAFEMVEELAERGLGGILVAHSSGDMMNPQLKEAGCVEIMEKPLADHVERIGELLGCEHVRP